MAAPSSRDLDYRRTSDYYGDRTWDRTQYPQRKRNYWDTDPGNQGWGRTAGFSDRDIYDFGGYGLHTARDPDLNRMTKEYVSEGKEED